MNTAPPAPPIRVLIDLKPALDGFAGIPQESRLLFRGLSAMDILRVDGLIQHGAKRLRPALRSESRPLSLARRINRLSRFVVSLYEKPYNNQYEAAGEYIAKGFIRQWMQIQAYAGLQVSMSHFPSELFSDFVWRTFFSKTLNPVDKAQLQGASFRVLAPDREMFHQTGLAGLKFTRSPSYPTLDTSGFDYFLTQTPFPGRVSKGTTMIVRYHDAVPILMPHTIKHKAFHQATHFQALKDNVRRGAWFSCISHATRADLLQIFPEVEGRSSVIHNIVSDEYFVEDSHPDMVLQIVRNRPAEWGKTKVRLPETTPVPPAGQKLRYLLMVSTIEPRKNHLLLMQAWEHLKYTRFPDLKIIFVGNAGWDEATVLQAFKPWAERGDLFWLNNVPSAELRVLYRHANVTICPGLAEGFDYSGVEAMKCGCLVASSDIAVHREIYGAASAYFDPYDAEHAAGVIGGMLESPAEPRFESMRADGLQVASQYSAQTIMPLWSRFFRQIHADAGQAASPTTAHNSAL